MRAVHVVAGATLVTAALPAFGAVSPAHVSADPVAVDESYAPHGNLYRGFGRPVGTEK